MTVTMVTQFHKVIIWLYQSETVLFLNEHFVIVKRLKSDFFLQSDTLNSC